MLEMQKYFTCLICLILFAKYTGGYRKSGFVQEDNFPKHFVYLMETEVFSGELQLIEGPELNSWFASQHQEMFVFQECWPLLAKSGFVNISSQL